MDLQSIGADTAIVSAFETWAAQGLVLGRVALAQRDQYRLYTETGDFSAEASGALWHRAAGAADMPVTGDSVAARVIAPGQAIVDGVVPRRTCFSRRAAGRREDEQPLAANIDVVFLVCGLDGNFNPRRLERYLVLALESGAAAVVVLNKADLCPDLPARLVETLAIARAVPVVAVSARDGALDSLAPWLGRGTTVALLGSSGVGKSTLANRLVGEERLWTGEVREGDSRGRHTTTQRELVPLPAGGALIDTPGLRELQLWAGADSVGLAFDEIDELAVRCRYRDCSHSVEPGCAVAEALAEGRLAAERFESYRKLLKEARRHENLADPLAAQEHKRNIKQLHRAGRALYTTRGRRIF
jgi:ribosome biogenesis GTPase